MNYLVGPVVGIFEFLFIPANHFPGWGISVILDLTFLPLGGEFDSIFFGKCQNPALCPASSHSPHRLDIDALCSKLSRHHLSDPTTDHDIEDITCPRVDMNFIFEWSTQYLTSERSERVRYRVDHEKIKFISISGHVMFCLLYKHQ